MVPVSFSVPCLLPSPLFSSPSLCLSLPSLPPSLIFLYAFLPLSPLLSPFQGQATLIKEAVDNMGDAPPALFDMLGEGVDVKDLDSTLTVGGSATSSKRGGKVSQLQIVGSLGVFIPDIVCSYIV